jgi:hypothetical protein
MMMIASHAIRKYWYGICCHGKYADLNFRVLTVIKANLLFLKPLALETIWNESSVIAGRYTVQLFRGRNNLWLSDLLTLTASFSWRIFLWPFKMAC